YFRNELAVLQALSSTVQRDPTASHYRFQDDPYLTPRTASEFKLFSLSQESGRNAAKYIINTYPNFFLKDYAEPHIPCLMPESLQPKVTEVCEAGLRELIHLRKVRSAVDMYDRLLQAGTVVSLELTNNLLDLICFYGDQDPVQGDQAEPEKTAEGEVVQDPAPRRKEGRFRKSDSLHRTWRKDNNAERIFHLMPERNERSYGALIRGMVKYGAHSKAFDLYTDMQNNRMAADVHAFNALIAAAPEVRQKYSEKWDLIAEMLKQMNKLGVRPTLLTFNTVLKSLLRCGPLSRALVLQVLGEMKALGIEPSLATYYHILVAFYRQGEWGFIPKNKYSLGMVPLCIHLYLHTPARWEPGRSVLIVLLCLQCCSLKDLGLAYRVHSLLNVGDNWKLLGNPSREGFYYGSLFNLVCMMENIGVVLQWYRDLVPSLFYPNSHTMRDLLQALDADNRLDLIPEIWKDVKQLGLATVSGDLAEEVLALMARDEHSPEIQESFANCALAVKAVYGHGEQSQATLDFTASALCNMATILLAAGRTDQAWEILQLFKANNRVPSEKLLDEFLNSAKSGSNSEQAVTLVQMSSSFSLPATARLAQRVEQEFDLSEEQKKALQDVEATILSDAARLSAQLVHELRRQLQVAVLDAVGGVREQFERIHVVGRELGGRRHLLRLEKKHRLQAVARLVDHGDAARQFADAIEAGAQRGLAVDTALQRLFGQRRGERLCKLVLATAVSDGLDGAR
ncbi:pentatricopeptide repeat domain-containing protein 3, mitochondrial-like, partial [Scleropages formosus]